MESRAPLRSWRLVAAISCLQRHASTPAKRGPVPILPRQSVQDGAPHCVTMFFLRNGNILSETACVELIARESSSAMATEHVERWCLPQFPRSARSADGSRLRIRQTQRAPASRSRGRRAWPVPPLRDLRAVVAVGTNSQTNTTGKARSTWVPALLLAAIVQG